MSTKAEAPPSDADSGPRAFSVLIQKFGDGDAHDQISEEVQVLTKVMVARAREQVKTVKGSLTITLNFACDEKGMIDTGYAIKRTEPQPKRPRTVFWADKNGNLTEKNPRQIELGLRDVSDKKREAKEPTAAPAARDV